MATFLARRRLAIAAALIAAFAMWARGWGIGAEPMWLDEAYSAYAASQGWTFLWQTVPRYETHPPFYYSLLRLWTLLAGDGLIAHRMLGLICGLALLPVMAFAARRMADLMDAAPGPVIVAALALTAVSPMLVEMSREVRPYPLMILSYAGAIWALFDIAARRAQGLPLAGPAFAGLCTTTALLLWLHNLGPLYAAALGLALLCVARPKTMTKADWLWLGGGTLAILLVWLPALWILLGQAPEWVRATWLTWSTDNLWRRVSVIHFGPGDDMRAAAAILTLIGAWLAWRAAGGRRLLAVLLILALFPAIVAMVVSETIAPIFIIRTMTPLAVPAILLMATAVGARNRSVLLAALVALVWLVIAQARHDIDARERPRRDWYQTIDWLAPRFRPGDMLFAYPNEGALPFDRAVRDSGLELPSRPIPTAIPSLDPPPGSRYVSGSRGVPSLDRKHLRMIAEAPETRAIDTIWLLRLGPWAYDPGDTFLEELSRDRLEIGRYRNGAIDIIGLRRGEIDPETGRMTPWTRADLQRIGRCMNRHASLSDLRRSTICFRHSRPERIVGTWLIGEQGSWLFERTGRSPAAVTLSPTTPWLEILPGISAHRPANMGSGKAYRVAFIGRRSIEPGLFGEQGLARNQILVDKLIAIRPVTMPKVTDALR